MLSVVISCSLLLAASTLAQPLINANLLEPRKSHGTSTSSSHASSCNRRPLSKRDVIIIVIVAVAATVLTILFLCYLEWSEGRKARSKLARRTLRSRCWNRGIGGRNAETTQMTMAPDRESFEPKTHDEGTEGPLAPLLQPTTTSHAMAPSLSSSSSSSHRWSDRSELSELSPSQTPTPTPGPLSRPNFERTPTPPQMSFVTPSTPRPDSPFQSQLYTNSHFLPPRLPGPSSTTPEDAPFSPPSPMPRPSRYSGTPELPVLENSYRPPSRSSLRRSGRY